MRAEALQKKVEEMVLDSYEAMYRLAYTYVRNEEDALDIVQESVYKAIKHSSSVKQEGYIKTWLWRIVMNTALDFIRKNQKEIAVDAFFENGKEDSYQDFDTIEALKVLTEKEKTELVLVAQTTYHTNFWIKCCNCAKKHYTNPIFFDTIFV